MMYAKSNDVLLLESSIGNYDRFTVHVSGRTGNHGARIKISNSSKGYGTSVPILYDNKIMDYDELRYHKAVNIDRTSEKYLPILIAFTILYKDELVKYAKALDAGANSDDVHDELATYLDTFFYKYKGASHSDMRKVVDLYLKSGVR